MGKPAIISLVLSGIGAVTAAVIYRRRRRWY